MYGVPLRESSAPRTQKHIHRVLMKVRLVVLVLVGILCSFSAVEAQKVAVKSNLLYAASMNMIHGFDAPPTPNLGVEFYLSGHWTAGLNAGYMPWPSDSSKERKWKHLLISPEARYWFCSPFSRDFIGFNAIYSHFNVGKVHFPFGLYPSLRDKRRQGDMVAVGATYGYSWILSPHWSLEAEAGIDVGYAWYKEYDCAHCGTYYGKDKKPFLMPKVGVSIVYNIK